MPREQLVAGRLPELVAGGGVVHAQLPHTRVQSEHPAAPVGELERAEHVAHSAASSVAGLSPCAVGSVSRGVRSVTRGRSRRVGGARRVERPARRELPEAHAPPLPEGPRRIPGEHVERARGREQLVAVEGAAAREARDGHAVVPAVEHGERPRERATAVAEHPHAARQPAGVAQVDDLLARGVAAERECSHAMPALGPDRRQAFGFERVEVEPRGDDLAQHGGTANGAPRGIRVQSSSSFSSTRMRRE